MSLKAKKEDSLEEMMNETIQEKIVFEDLEYEAEALTDEELEELNKPTSYLTISGKETAYYPDWDKFTIRDAEVGTEFTGKPEINVFKNDEKTYDAMRLRLLNQKDEEILDLYFNYPKKDYPVVKGVNKGFDFYRTLFDFIYSILRWRSEDNVLKNGQPVNKFNNVNLENFAKYVDYMDSVTIRVTEGNPESEYNSWIITEMK